LPKLDELTGLLSGQNLEVRLDRLLDQADDEGGRVSVVILDLGGLRAINERFGREGGDEVLRTVARTISATVGDAGLCYRLGGDCFVVLYRGLDSREAQAAALALKEAIAKTRAAVRDKETVGLNAFCGVSTYPGDAQHAKSLIKAADRRMQQARLEAEAAGPLTP
jgi:diguanylate cyclase (GGDEF)-like protein